MHKGCFTQLLFLDTEFVFNMSIINTAIMNICAHESLTSSLSLHISSNKFNFKGCLSLSGMKLVMIFTMITVFNLLGILKNHT